MPTIPFSDLEHSIQLRDNGFPAHLASFAWVKTDKWVPMYNSLSLLESKDPNIAAAPYATTILDLLPLYILTPDDDIKIAFFEINRGQVEDELIYFVEYEQYLNSEAWNTAFCASDKSLANAAAKMWIDLKKAGIIT